MISSNEFEFVKLDKIEKHCCLEITMKTESNLVDLIIFFKREGLIKGKNLLRKNSKKSVFHFMYLYIWFRQGVFG